jgi:magnesium-transporting ATPase (P-type)
LGVVLIAVVCITSIFSYYQEAKSDAVMKGFEKYKTRTSLLLHTARPLGFLKMQPQRSHVLRDGKWSEVDADFLVVGDIITVTYGKSFLLIHSRFVIISTFYR